MRTKILLSIGLIAFAGFILTPSIVKAYQGDPNVKGPNYTEERHEAMEKAFENNDYQAWKDLMGDRGHAKDVITAENFPKFAQVHQMMEDGDVDGARQLRNELGLGLNNGHGNGSNKSRGCDR